MSGDHVAADISSVGNPKLSVPIFPPISAVNNLSLSIFNSLYYNRPLGGVKIGHCIPYFYPLDGILNWNRMYGPKGFFQYQFAIPLHEKEALSEILKKISDSGMGSFLAVIKTFGEKQSPGYFSFPIPGVTLALDFPNNGSSTIKLFNTLDSIVKSANGRLYAAKDSLSDGSIFMDHPGFQKLIQFADKKASSNFIRRIKSS